jgi:hypothetical protein
MSEDYRKVERLAFSLSPAERYRLAERLLGLIDENGSQEGNGIDLMDLAGAAPGHLHGIDAQEWVNRIRNGDDLNATASPGAPS